MKSKNLIPTILLSIAINVLIGIPSTFAKGIAPEIREQVLQEILKESRQKRVDRSLSSFSVRNKSVILRGRWNSKVRNFVFERSSKSQLAKELHISKLVLEEKQDFMNLRNLALAGLSTGGVLYFMPQKNVVFWETEDNDIPNDSVEKNFWTNPILGSILNELLSKTQIELKRQSGTGVEPQRIKSILMIVLNPPAALAQTFNRNTSRPMAEGRTEIITEAPSQITDDAATTQRQTNYLGLRFSIHF